LDVIFNLHKKKKIVVAFISGPTSKIKTGPSKLLRRPWMCRVGGV